MLRALLLIPLMLIAGAGCPGGGVGDTCGGTSDCDGALQCLDGKCAAPCTRSPECGDGYRCDTGACVAAHGTPGDSCQSEGDCGPGLSCRIKGGAVDTETRRLVANCEQAYTTAPAGAACSSDEGCRNGTCELGHCVDLCADPVDCPLGYSCLTLPHVAANGALFSGCLPSNGVLSWSIPVTSPTEQILLPVPSSAQSAALVMSVDDPGQSVGALKVLDPCGCTRYMVPCPFGPTPGVNQPCTAAVAGDQFYSQSSGLSTTGTIGDSSGAGICSTQSRCDPEGSAAINHFRHLPGLGHSVLLMPTIPNDGELKLGAYQIDVSSFWQDGSLGSAIPRVDAVVRIGSGAGLELHFFFLDLTDHPCAAQTGNAVLNAASARSAAFFRDYLTAMREIFGRVGIRVSDASYEDVPGQPDLDALDIADTGSLFALGHHAPGVNVFFVRSLSPLGLEVVGPNPGPAGLALTQDSGIAISVDALCYRDWKALARLTAHAIARYLGLYHNVEPRDPSQPADQPAWQDLIPDSDLSRDNLMYFSDRGGTELSPGQGNTLARSGALRP